MHIYLFIFLKLRRNFFYFPFGIFYLYIFRVCLENVLSNVPGARQAAKIAVFNEAKYLIRQ